MSHLNRIGAVLLLASIAAFAQNPGRRVSDASTSAAPNNRYLIEFKTFGPQARGAVNAAGGRIVHEFPALNTIAAHLPPQAAQALQRNPNVNFIEADAPRYMMASVDAASANAQTVPYGITMVQADQLVGLNPSNRTVCIIDSGYYRGHEDLQTSFVNGSSDPNGAGDWFKDRSGHGTHVAGTIAALNNNWGVVGVHSGGALNLHIVKVFGDDGIWAYSSTLIAALDKCKAARANVVSMSLGGEFSSRAENNAFAKAYSEGILSVAAAGNDGNTRKSYPASYDSVISVAAIDSTKKLASFSQRNNAVELAAPGVAVLSTVPYLETNTVAAAGNTYSGTWVENAARTNGLTAVIADGGLCTSSNSAWQGRIVLCERGTNTFNEKVQTAKTAGATGVIIFNNVDETLNATLGDGNSSTIPAVGLNRADGLALKASAVGQNGTLVSTVQAPYSSYEAWDGTSMATPHVSAIAALIWSANVSWTNAQIRQALQATAQDLGTRGRDSSYGFGLVQGKAALDYLRSR